MSSNMEAEIEPQQLVDKPSSQSPVRSQPPQEIQSQQNQSKSPQQHISPVLEPVPSRLSPPSSQNFIQNPNICSNKICQSYKSTKHNQTHQNSVENLCAECLKQYKKQAYCIYCKQIYFEHTDDGKQWIMCEECERWVHTDCSDYYNNNQPNSIFYCVKCKKIDQIQTQQANNNRRGVGKVGLGGKVPERRKTQQCSLNNYGFYWQLSPGQLAEDFQKLKQLLK